MASALTAAACGVLFAGAAGILQWRRHLPAPPVPSSSLLLAPMIGVIEPCLLPPAISTTPVAEDLAQRCGGPQGSAAALVDATLAQLAPHGAARRYELGYTLPVPLLQLFKPEGHDWAIDPERVERFARTIRDSSRPVILYLFSTHFAANAPIEEALARDPANLGETRDGPLPPDTYYDSNIYNWSVARTDNSLTARRTQAMDAMLGALCRLGPEHLAKIRGVTLLGELHHLFPDFQAGMGFDKPYRITDYSARSAADFRASLRREFGRIDRLNRFLGADFASFDDVEPPARDIRREPLRRFTDHIDSYAHGTLPIAGWASTGRPADAGPAWVHLYRNGRFIGKTAARLGRQDVLQALPQLGTADVGWRYDLDFKRLPPGLHRIDAYLESRPGVLAHLGTRQIAVMDRQQNPPAPQPQQPLPASVALDGAAKANIDSPADQSAYYYNPLVPLWHAFRARQVASYLHHMDAVVARSCLAGTPHYTHQIVPFTNPSWDENKFAIGTSLGDMAPIRLGVSLYGEPTYGDGFLDWHARRHPGAEPYGVTEFHPLRPLDAAGLRGTLDRHAASGAAFVSFFLEPYWHGALVPRGHNMFSFDPANREFGSDQLYRATQQVLDPATPPLRETPRPQPMPRPVHP